MEQAESNRLQIALTASAARGCLADARTLLLSLPRRGRVAAEAERSEAKAAGWGVKYLMTQRRLGRALARPNMFMVAIVGSREELDPTYGNASTGHIASAGNH
jgi:hypothetical protein